MNSTTWNEPVCAEVSQSERLMDMGAAAEDYEVESDGSAADDATAVAAN